MIYENKAAISVQGYDIPVNSHAVKKRRRLYFLGADI